jgi:hypothetical protein
LGAGDDGAVLTNCKNHFRGTGRQPHNAPGPGRDFQLSAQIIRKGNLSLVLFLSLPPLAAGFQKEKGEASQEEEKDFSHEKIRAAYS